MVARWMACFGHDETWWSENCPASAVARSGTLSRRIPRARSASTMPRRSLPRLFAERDDALLAALPPNGLVNGLCAYLTHA